MITLESNTNKRITLSDMKTKLTFIEFIANQEQESIGWAEVFVKALSDKAIKDTKHHGDCTKHSEPCDLCTLESMFKDYYEYSFKKGIYKIDG